MGRARQLVAGRGALGGVGITPKAQLAACSCGGHAKKHRGGSVPQCMDHSGEGREDAGRIWVLWGCVGKSEAKEKRRGMHVGAAQAVAVPG